MTAGLIPPDLDIRTELREPVTDPTLGIPVDVDRRGTPTNRLVIFHRLGRCGAARKLASPALVTLCKTAPCSFPSTVTEEP